MTLRILLTGFRPWQDAAYNPSGAVARRLDGAIIDGAAFGSPLRAAVTSRILDVAWESGMSPSGPVLGAARVVAREVATLRPHILLGLGVRPSSPVGFDVEAIASDRTGGTDVRGKTPKTARLHTRWPETLVLPFPGKQVIEALVKAGFPAESLRGAGSFLCERIAYESARLARLRDASLAIAGFIHVPNPMVAAGVGTVVTMEDLERDPTQTEALTLARRAEEDVTRAIRIALAVCVSQIRLDAAGRPQRWSLRRDWLPTATFPRMPGLSIDPSPIPGDDYIRLEHWR